MSKHKQAKLKHNSIGTILVCPIQPWHPLHSSNQPGDSVRCTRYMYARDHTGRYTAWHNIATVFDERAKKITFYFHTTS